MLRLTLVRHAQAEPVRAGQADWDRVLEARGLRDVQLMARRLKERRLKPDRMLASPAVRALTTASLLARGLGLSAAKVEPQELLYLAGPKDILQVIRELGGPTSHLMLVGHNPGLTEFADRICAERNLDLLPTCGVFTLQFELPDWSALDWSSGFDAEFDYPGCYR